MKFMRKAIGFLIVLTALSHFFDQAFTALDDAASQGFQTLQTAAVVAEERLIKQ